jgi:hypothetical protein
MGFDLIIYEQKENEYKEIEYLNNGRFTGAREYTLLIGKICKDCFYEKREIFPDCYERGEYRYNISDSEYKKIKKELNSFPNKKYFIKITKLMKENKSIYFFDSY